MNQIDKTTQRLTAYLIAVLVAWSLYVAIYAYHLQGNSQGFGVEVICADQSEACSDAVEDINGGEL